MPCHMCDSNKVALKQETKTTISGIEYQYQFMECIDCGFKEETDINTFNNFKKRHEAEKQAETPKEDDVDLEVELDTELAVYIQIYADSHGISINEAMVKILEEMIERK